MHVPLRQRALGLALDVLMLVAFVFIVVDEGDVVWPVLVLVLTGRWGWGGPVPALLAWIGAALLVASLCVTQRTPYRAMVTAALVLMLGSAASYHVVAARLNPRLTLLSAIPFLLLFALRVAQVVWLGRVRLCSP